MSKEEAAVGRAAGTVALARQAEGVAGGLRLLAERMRDLGWHVDGYSTDELFNVASALRSSVLAAFGSIRRQQQEAEWETIRQLRTYVTVGEGARVPVSVVHRMTGIGAGTIERWREEQHAEQQHLPHARAGQAAMGTAESGGPAWNEIALASRRSDALVLEIVATAGRPVRHRDVVKGSGLSKGTVSKAVTRLAKAGHLERLEDGAIRPGPMCKVSQHP
ncbi:helix-turn-helix transcriptional regulator [Phaeacidiphilus oryzae]|uniref:helix-turn-helix transcriptional regulator n=1 Tax=Phaeacidiphilus oryzae TaxID=348818 RepID=UPI00055C41E2|nr:MarR family transcriptional regulator [Phaeacidiphilus oryzae]